MIHTDDTIKFPSIIYVRIRVICKMICQYCNIPAVYPILFWADCFEIYVMKNEIFLFDQSISVPILFDSAPHDKSMNIVEISEANKLTRAERNIF